MATPEQNTLLALQLFGQPAQQYAHDTGRVLDLRSKVAMLQQQQDFQRETQDRQAQRQDSQLTALQTREDSRQTAQNTRQDSQLTAMQTREDSKATAAEKKQLKAAFVTVYPKYAAAAKRLGVAIKSLEEYDETFEGLGQLQADMAELEQEGIQRNQDAAATAAVGELDAATMEAQDARKVLEATMKATPEDEQFAKSQAVTALTRAIENSDIASIKAGSKAAKDGLAALARGERTIAAKLLGDEVLAQFDNAYQAALSAAPNFKSRMQERTIAQQNFQSAQRNLSAIQSDLRKASAGNVSLARGLTERRTGLQQLMTAPEAPKTPPTFDQIFKKSGAGAGAPAPQTPVRGGIALLANPENDAIITKENDRLKAAETAAAGRDWQANFGDPFNESIDRVEQLQSQIGLVRSGDAGNMARVVNPMGGYIPGPADPTIQARELSRLLQEVQRAKQEQEVRRRQMLGLQLQPVIGR